MLRWMGTAFAAGLMLTASGAIWADEVVRLGGSTAQNSIQGGTDTELVRGYYGGYRGGFYGGYRGGYYGGYRGGYYGGGFHNRGYYGGGFYNRGYYGARYYTPYFSVGYYSRPYYGYGYGNSYYYQPYSYASYYYYPCAGEVAPVMTLQAQTPTYTPSYSSPAPQPFMPPATQTPGNYSYDGGPNQPVPMPAPGVNTNPAKTPSGIIPLDGKLVSLPAGITGGFSPVSLAPQPRTSVTNNVPRVTYPAYGEQH